MRLEKLPTIEPKPKGNPTPLCRGNYGVLMKRLSDLRWCVKTGYEPFGGWWCEIYWRGRPVVLGELAHSEAPRWDGTKRIRYDDPYDAFAACIRVWLPKYQAYCVERAKEGAPPPPQLKLLEKSQTKKTIKAEPSRSSGLWP